MVSTHKVRSETRKTEQDPFGRRFFSKERSVREVEEFRVHPNIFNGLGQGQVIKISGLRDAGYAAIDVALANKTNSDEYIEILKDSFVSSRQIKRINFDVIEKMDDSFASESSRGFDDSGVFL